MIKYIYFDPDEWFFNPYCVDNVGEKKMLTDFLGNKVKGYQIGSWIWQWSEIVSPIIDLEENTDYIFCFWLNGGENDRHDEICQLHITFDNDYEKKLVFKLNRGITKPVKTHGGWGLYEIKFNSGEHQVAQLRFAAMNAPMSVIPALDEEEYSSLKNDGLMNNGGPQRHNIVFKNGFPDGGEKTSNSFLRPVLAALGVLTALTALITAVKIIYNKFGDE